MLSNRTARGPPLFFATSCAYRLRAGSIFCEISRVAARNDPLRAADRTQHQSHSAQGHAAPDEVRDRAIGTLRTLVHDKARCATSTGCCNGLRSHQPVGNARGIVLQYREFAADNDRPHHISHRLFRRHLHEGLGSGGETERAMRSHCRKQEVVLLSPRSSRSMKPSNRTSLLSSASISRQNLGTTCSPSTTGMTRPNVFQETTPARSGNSVELNIDAVGNPVAGTPVSSANTGHTSTSRSATTAPMKNFRMGQFLVMSAVTRARRSSPRVPTIATCWPPRGAFTRARRNGFLHDPAILIIVYHYPLDKRFERRSDFLATER